MSLITSAETVFYTHRGTGRLRWCRREKADPRASLSPDSRTHSTSLSLTSCQTRLQNKIFPLQLSSSVGLKALCLGRQKEDTRTKEKR